MSADGEFHGTGELERLDVQAVFRSVGYRSVPLDGVPFDPRTHTVPSADGRVLDADGKPLPGEYVAGWLKRGPTGVIGTNKADGAQTAQAILADLAGGPGAGEAGLPRPGLLRLPTMVSGDTVVSGDTAGPGDAGFPLEAVLSTRGVCPVGYDDWLRIESAEADLARNLRRGERVKLPGAAAVWSAAGVRRNGADHAG